MTRFLLTLCLCVLFVHDVAASTEFPDRFQLIQLFRESNFVELNDSLQGYQQAFETGEGDERLLLFAIESITAANPDSEYLLNEWVKSQPNNYAPYLARAYYYYHIAWSWRGHDNIKTTAQYRLTNMHKYLESAADDLTIAIEIQPSLTIAYALAIRILMLIGSEELRNEAYNEAIIQYPNSYLVRASYLWSLKPKWGGSSSRLLEYVREIQPLVAQNPSLQDLLGYSDYIFAESLSDSQEYEQAREHYDFAIAKGADHIVYRERGINHYQLGDYEQALQDFNTSLESWPQNYRVLRWRANVYMRQGQFNEAVQDLALAVELNPYNKYALLSLAAVLRKVGKFEGVLDLYDRALYYNSQDARIWFERGMHYSRDLFKFNLASRDLKRATDLAPQKTQYWYQYAASLHYSFDCGITKPLEKYLSLCSNEMGCNQKELEWARKAELWLQQNEACRGS